MFKQWTSGDTAAAAAAVTALSIGVGVFWRKIGHPLTFGLLNLVRDWNGRPERRGRDGSLIEEARPGVMGRLRKMEENDARQNADIASIKEQLQPNAGKSLYDAVRRVDATVASALSNPSAVVNIHTDGNTETSIDQKGSSQ